MTSQKYIDQLLTDIKAAHRQDDKFMSDDEGTLPPFEAEDHYMEADSYLEFDFENGPTLGEQIGITGEVFPQVLLLSPPQITSLEEALRQLIFSYGIHTDMPDDLPEVFSYILFIRLLDTPLDIGEAGTFGWDFCTDDPAYCPFEIFCECKKTDREIVQEEKAAKMLMAAIQQYCTAILAEYDGRLSSEISAEALPADSPCLLDFIAGGRMNVPDLVFYEEDDLKKVLTLLRLLFQSQPDLINLISDMSKPTFDQNLYSLFHMKCNLDPKGTLTLEPFYIDYETIMLGLERQYTPEELMDKLEKDDEVPF